MENERIAKLETTVESIKEAVSRLEEKFDELLERIEQRYLPRSEYERAMNQLESRISKQEMKIEELKKSAGKVPAWAVSLITTLFTSLVAVVIALFNR